MLYVAYFFDFKSLLIKSHQLKSASQRRKHAFRSLILLNASYCCHHCMFKGHTLGFCRARRQS